MDLELLKRYFKDKDLYFPAIPDEGYQEWVLHRYNLFEDFKEFSQEVISRFTSTQNFLDTFAFIRNQAVSVIQERDEYKAFLVRDMSDFSIPEDLRNVKKGNIYTSENIGKKFLSLDLRSANFQALKYIGVHTEESYAKYMETFSDFPYFWESKSARSFIYGRLSPRIISVEKYIISLIWEQTKTLGTLVSFNNDELVYEVPGDFVMPDIDFKFNVKVNIFTLLGWRIENERGKGETFYQKNENGPLYCLPGQFSFIVGDLMSGNEIEANSRLFSVDSNVAEFKDNFRLRRL